MRNSGCWYLWKQSAQGISIAHIPRAVAPHALLSRQPPHQPHYNFPDRRPPISTMSPIKSDSREIITQTSDYMLNKNYFHFEQPFPSYIWPPHPKISLLPLSKSTLLYTRPVRTIIEHTESAIYNRSIHLTLDLAVTGSPRIEHIGSCRIRGLPTPCPP